MNLTLKIAAGIVLAFAFMFVVVETGSLLALYFSDQGGSAREAADEMERINAEYERKRAEIEEERKTMCEQGDTYWCNR